MMFLKVDYDKQLHLWNLTEIGPPERLIAKRKRVTIKTRSELIVDDPPHGYLVVSGIIDLKNGDHAVITKGK